MTQLGLSVLPSRYETATSWVSRLAARNGATYVQDFVLDMGLDWRRVINGDQETLTEISAIAGACPSAVLAFAKRTLPNRDTFIGPVPVGAKFCQNNIMSICPVCVSDWMGENGQLTEGAKVWWQAVSIRSCAKHRIQLLNLPPPTDDLRENYDFAGRVADHRAEILAAAQTPLPAPESRYEKYIQARLTGESDHEGGGLMTSRFRRSAIFAMHLA